jgi:peptidoglycan/LPS O-acetylase OafA/YrhL
MYEPKLIRIKHIDALRGIAAILVTFFHLSGSSGLSARTASLGRYGYSGVEIFFVISGFVLPYSLLKSKYQLKNFPSFMAKRIVRIYPAYIAAIIIGVGLTYYAGRRLLPFKDIITQLTFLNAIVGYSWTSAVFWTLSIEFQFYILIGLIFKYFSGSNLSSLILIFSLVLVSFFITSPAFIFHWFPFFALGILVYNIKFTQMHPGIFWLATALIVIVAIFKIGLPEAIAGSAALLFIMYIRMENKTKFNNTFLWLGTISYSLYLVHWELGRSAVIVARHIPALGGSDPFRLLVGMMFSVICGYLLYYLVEKRSIKLSHKIQYKTKAITTDDILT